jgi:hypothetical protein
MRTNLEALSNHKKLDFRAIFHAKSSVTVSRSILSNIFFSMEHIAKPFSLSCDIVDLNYFFSSFSFEKLLSADATVAGTVNRIT